MQIKLYLTNKETLAVLCSVAKPSLELLEHSSSWGNVRRVRRTGFRFRLTGKARLVVKKKGNRQIHSKKWSVIVQIVRWRDTVTLLHSESPGKISRLMFFYANFVTSVVKFVHTECRYNG